MSSHTAPASFTRTLQMTVPGSSEVREIVVLIGLPECDPVPGGDFRALVEIEGVDEPFSRHFHGADEIQAFLAACWIVSQILPTLVPPGAKLTWLGTDKLGFGDSSESP